MTDVDRVNGLRVAVTGGAQGIGRSISEHLVARGARVVIGDVQKAVPDFYEAVGQYLKAWQPPAPPLPQEKAQPSDVAPEALRQQADEIALARNE